MRPVPAAITEEVVHRDPSRDTEPSPVRCLPAHLAVAQDQEAVRRGVDQPGGPCASCEGQLASRRDSSSVVSSISAAAAESVIEDGRLAPGMGMTTGDCASSQASATC